MRINLAWQDRTRRLRLELAPGARMLSPSGRALIAQLAGGGEQHRLTFHGSSLEVTL